MHANAAHSIMHMLPAEDYSAFVRLAARSAATEFRAHHTSHPGNQSIRVSDDAQRAEMVAYELGQVAYETLWLTPFLDVCRHHDNPIPLMWLLRAYTRAFRNDQANALGRVDRDTTTH